MKGDTIPNGEFLYKYVKPHFVPSDQTEVPYGIFEDQELSCDWEKYQKSPEKSFHISEGKNKIIRITVCDEIKYPCNPIRPRQKQPAWEQKVEHDPILKGEDFSHPTIENLSHSLIKGTKKIHITKAIALNSIFYKTVNLEEAQQAHRRFSLPISKVVLFILVIFLLLLLIIWQTN